MRVRFQEASEAVAFLAGHYMADKWHEAKAENDAMHEAAAEEGRDAEERRRRNSVDSRNLITTLHRPPCAPVDLGAFFRNRSYQSDRDHE